MDQIQLDALWKELGRALYIAWHEGLDVAGKRAWELEDEYVQEIWRRITHPQNRDMLRSQIGTGGNPDGEQMIQEAYRQATARIGTG